MLKLYVWEGVLTDHSSGLAIALAETATEAKKLLIKEGLSKKHWKGIAVDGQQPIVKEQPCAFYVYGGA